ncbi:MAG: MaoC/PaaZ C-terminal domain-containing protein [Gammaproteobacteria bacterium]
MNYENLRNWKFQDVEQTYTEKDSILYALGLGVGMEPTNPGHLRFTYERDLRALPTLSVVLCWLGPWVRHPDIGVDYSMVLHGEQSVEIVKPLPAAARVVAKTRLLEVVDKGREKGAIIAIERAYHDAASGDLLCRNTAATFARADGGFGGPATSTRTPHAIPDRAPDDVFESRTSTQSALLYRLSGDYNILHADPEAATKAGFRVPILHGLCTFGVVGFGLLGRYGNYDPDRFRGIGVRFSAPVYPGETLRTEVWRDGETYSFRTSVPERKVTVLNNAWAKISA